MRLIRKSRGQSTAEYAVLFALVIGAAIGMQTYVKGRLQGAVKFYADDYSTKAKTKGSKTFSDNSRKTTSQSTSDIRMSKASKGTVKIDSKSNSVTKLK